MGPKKSRRLGELLQHASKVRPLIVQLVKRALHNLIVISMKNGVSLPYVGHKLIYHFLIAVGPFKSQSAWGEHDHGHKYLVMLINDRIAVSITAPFPMITFSKMWENDGLFCTNSASRLFLSAPSSAKGSLPKEHSDVKTPPPLVYICMAS